jgi:Prophage tail length tape measure protein
MAETAASAMSLGKAIVSIGGDLTKLKAAFAEAKALRDAFEKDMATGSSGLLNFTKAANDAAPALDAEIQKTKEAGDAAAKTADQLNKLATSEKTAADASKARSSALETEAEKTARLSAMVDASIAKMSQSNLSTRASSFLGASVPREATGQGSIPAGYLEGTALGSIGAMAGKDAVGIKAAADALKLESAAVEELGTKTKLSSASIREILVLLREAGRGDFTRMAGSASLLGQQLGLVEKLGGPLIGLFGALAAGVAVLGLAFAKGSAEANHFANQLAITGNYAGLTADSYEDMAHRIAAATNSSIGSNKELVASAAQTNNFTAAQIEKLVTASQKLARATGEDADKILADFLRMADGPTKYAEAFQHAHIGVISPTRMNEIRELEAQGAKTTEIYDLIIDGVTRVANKTVEQTGYIIRAWHAATLGLADFWEWLKRIGTDDTASEQLAKLDARIKLLKTINPTSGVLTGLEQQRGLLKISIDLTNAKTVADQNAAAATDASAKALDKIHDGYLKSVDSLSRYHDGVKQLNNTLADALKVDPKTSVPTMLAMAARSGIPDLVAFSQKYDSMVDKIKKQTMPEAYKAENKAENAAAALAKRQAEALAATEAEAATLRIVLPLYENQSLSLDQVNRAKTIAIKLAGLKESADSAEGRAQAKATGAVYDMTEAIKSLEKARAQLDSLTEKDDAIKAEIASLGLSAGALAYNKTMVEELAKAKKDHTDAIPGQTAAIEKDAAAIRDHTDALEHDRMVLENDKAFIASINALRLQAETFNMGREAAAAYSYEITKKNDAILKGVPLTEHESANVRLQAQAYAEATEAMARLNEKQTAANFANQELENSIIDIVFNSKSLVGALQDITKALAEAGLKAILFGDGPLAGVLGKSAAETGGGGGLIGGFANSIFGTKKAQAGAIDAASSVAGLKAPYAADAMAMSLAFKRTTADLIAFGQALKMAGSGMIPGHSSGGGGLLSKLVSVGSAVAGATSFGGGNFPSIAGMADKPFDLGTIDTSALTQFPKFANGTKSAPGGFAWVGERGPELIRLPRGAEVIPTEALLNAPRGPGAGSQRPANDDMAGTGGSNGVRFGDIHVSGMTPQNARKTAKQLAGTAQRRIQATSKARTAGA